MNEVCSRYYTSAFLGHTRSHDLIEAFTDNINKKMLTKIIQISMDGPNVNLRFLKDLQENEDCKKFIDIGTCGLHILHNAFKTSFNDIEWKIGEFLKALFYLFENQPARRQTLLRKCYHKAFSNALFRNTLDRRR